jgi:hypothetical protein
LIFVLKLPLLPVFILSGQHEPADSGFKFLIFALKLHLLLVFIFLRQHEYPDWLQIIDFCPEALSVTCFHLEWTA